MYQLLEDKVRAIAARYEVSEDYFVSKVKTLSPLPEPGELEIVMDFLVSYAFENDYDNMFDW